LLQLSLDHAICLSAAHLAFSRLVQMVRRIAAGKTTGLRSPAIESQVVNWIVYSLVHTVGVPTGLA
jgi:hypothetical protein